MIAREHKSSFIAARPRLFVALAVVIGVGLLLTAQYWDRAPTRSERRVRINDAVDVVAPPPLSEEETKGSGVALRQDRVSLDAGAWVQVADDRGRLQQRYRAQRIDPEPDRWVRMEQPHAIMYPSEGRVIIMRADHGRARVPKRALQAGRLTGNVQIRIFRGREGQRVRFNEDEPIDRPAMTILSDEAQFDEVLGEIRCDGWVDIAADEERVVDGRVERRTVTFKGEGLSIGVDPEHRSIERLVVERPLTPIVITKSVDMTSAGSGGNEGRSHEAAKASPIASSTDAAPQGSASSGSASAASNGVVPAMPTVPPSGSAPTMPTAASVAIVNDTTAAPPVAAPASAAPLPSSSSTAPEDDGRIYRLTLNDDVIIHRLADGRESIVRGDRLVALFSLKSSGLRDAFASVFPVLPAAEDFETLCLADREDFAPPPWLSLPWPGRLAMLSLGTVQSTAPATSAANDPPASSSTVPVSSETGNERITFRYKGRLVMAPAGEDVEPLTSPEDMRLAIESSERGTRRFVEVEDVRTLARARCDRLVYRGADESVDLEGSVRQPFEMESPRLKLEGGRFRFERRSGHGEIPGAGRMKLGDPERAMTSIAGAAASQGPAPAAGDASAPGSDTKGAPPRPVTAAIPTRDLEITWKDRLDIELDDAAKGSRIKLAHFQGSVLVDHVDFALRSKGLRVLFGPGKDGDADATVQSIIADGGAKAERLTESGSLSARIIAMQLDQDKTTGRITPRTLTARGTVEAQDKSQTMWSDDLVVEFTPRAEGAKASASSPKKSDGAKGAIALGEEMGDVEVTTVRAGTLPGLDAVKVDGISLAEETRPGDRPDGGVQILLKDGARVFARQLTGDARERRVKLEGPDVMIVHQNIVADQLQHLNIDEGKGTITAEGPGRFRHFREPVVDATPEPRQRPDPKSAVALDATWNDRMHFDDRANGGGGSIDLNGGVRVRASRTNREFSALDANTVQLDLRNDPNATPREASEGAMLATGTRSLQRMIAKGSAHLENQTWPTDARVGEPRLFRVAGEHIEYDTITGEAKVVGGGSLLVHDTGEKPVGAGAGGGPDARGTSRFKWGSSMDMTRLGSQQFLVLMNDGVEVLHSGLQQNDTFTMTCRTLETTLLRPGFGTDAAMNAVPSDAASGRLAKSADVDLGGPAELLRLKAIGQVFVRAPDADIECEEFDYDIRTQIAQIKARDGRLVTVLRRDNPTPIRATSVLWDRATGRMTIQSGSGAIGR